MSVQVGISTGEEKNRILTLREDHTHFPDTWLSLELLLELFSLLRAFFGTSLSSPPFPLSVVSPSIQLPAASPPAVHTPDEASEMPGNKAPERAHAEAPSSSPVE